MSTTQLGLHPSFAVIPFVSQALTVFYALVEPTVFIPFLHAAHTDRAATQRVLRLWFNSFKSFGLITIFSVTLPAIISGFYAARQLPLDTLQWKLYAAGATFSSAHFLFGGKIMTLINNLCNEQSEKKGETLETLRQWLHVHLIRTLVADVPALLCFGYLVLGP